MVSLYETWRDAVRAEQPVALATVIDGPGVGNKLVVSTDLDWMMRLSDLLRPLAPSTFSSLASALGEVRDGRPAVVVAAPQDLDELLADPTVLRGGAIGAVGVTERVTISVGVAERVTIAK